MARKPPIPITIVAGPRGAGKTTLINRLLEDRRFANTAVILNDFGEVAVKNAVVEAAEDGFIALGSGCVCCAVRGALTDGLEKLLRDLDNGRLAHLDRVVIEADAAASPTAILGAFLTHPYLALRFTGDGIVALLDATTAMDALAANGDAVMQVASADVIVLSRSDHNTALADMLRRLNPVALVVDSSIVAPKDLTGHSAFDPAFGNADAWVAAADPAAGPPLAGEAGRIRVFALARERAIPFAPLERFLEYVVALHGDKLVRIRGVVATAEGEAAIVDGAGRYFHPPLVIDRDGPPLTRFAVTTRDLDADTFAAYLDAFLNEARIDTPDRAALTDNPLAIAGFSARSGR